MNRPDPETVAHKLKAINMDYERKRRKRQAVKRIPYLRVRELNRLYKARCRGLQLPNDDAGSDYLRVIADHIAQLSNPHQRMRVWASERATWCTGKECDDLISQALRNPRRWTAEALGSELNLTIAERDCLQIRTIRAADCTATELKERQKERKRQAQEDRRRKAGAKPREQYERQSASRTRPWEAFGMSERTWRRKGKPKPPNTTEVRHPGILAEVRTQYLSILWSTHFGQNTEKTGWLQGAAQLAAGGARKRAPP